MRFKIRNKVFGVFIALLTLMLVACTTDTNTPSPEPEPTEKVTVTFDTVDGKIEHAQIEKGTKISRPTDPTRNGYEFIDWFKTISSDIPFNFDDIIMTDTTIYAKWEEETLPVNKVTVTFNTNGGTSVVSQEVASGSKALEPSAPTRKDHTFKYWTLDGEIFNFNMIITSDITLVAIWEIEDDSQTRWTVTFDTNGGTSIPSQKVVDGSVIIEVSNPTRQGYTFLEWTLNGETFDFDTQINRNITLKAQWEEDEIHQGVIYEHNFDSQGKESTFLTFDESNNTGSNYGQTIYQGITFSKGYKINSSGKITFTTTQDNLVLVLVVGQRTTEAGPFGIGVNDDIKQITQPQQTLTFVLAKAGKYDITRGSNTYKESGIFFLGIYSTEETIMNHRITFETNGGSSVQSIDVADGQTINFGSEPTKNDFDFVGWYIDETLETPFNPNTTIDKPMTLYAKWDVLERFEVTVDGVSYTVLEGKKLPSITPTFKEGKVFDSWKVDGNTFDISTPITENLTIIAHYRDALVYEISLNLNGGILDTEEYFTLYEYEKLELGSPSKEDHVFVGWYLDSGFEIPFKSGYLNSDINLYARFILQTSGSDDLNYGSYLESIYATWEDTDALNANVKYRQKEGNWLNLDKELLRQMDRSNGRIDIVGLSEGYYDLMIIKSDGKTLFVNNVFTGAHDRSGYAHFNYTSGIGGYKDDGTPKDDAIIIYVTEENKDTITIPGLPQVGLGWILNNAQYTKAGSSTYHKYQANETLSAFNKPIIFRIIGKVTTPDGATGYDSLINGGSEGDNGHMLRIKDANHITIEGIGEDAEIYGWGIHFMASVAGRGEGFHVRNLIFRDYPEDAIGMEGVQTGDRLTAPVTRGWIHHVTFYHGFSAKPAESDKAEGDGSLDIKRGEYFTISYNKFEGAHKTNLVGASDSNKQYHITFHHNWWQNNASRIPLARQANIHMYNNVFEITDDNKNEASYAQNTRATAYIFSEANYFYGTKNPGEVRSGAIKSFGDVFYSTFGEHGATVVNSRTQNVSSGNLFENFDTNSNVFYYDSVNQKTNVKHLTDAVTARAEVEMYAGSYKVWNSSNIEGVKITDATPEVISESRNVTTNTKISKGVPMLVFRLNTDADFEMTAGSGNVPPVLSTIYGEYLVVGTGKVTLKPGVYVIESRQAHGASKGTSQAKDSNVASYSITLDTGAASEARIKEATDAINALPSIILYNNEHKQMIETARLAFDSLREEEKNGINEQAIIKAENDYSIAGANHIENLIDSIGSVDENSLTLISTARAAFDLASQTIKNLISNLEVLIAAESEFESFHVNSIIKLIDELDSFEAVDVTNKQSILDLKSDYEMAFDAFNQLSESQKNQITNTAKLTEGLTFLDDALLPFEITDLLEQINIDEISLSNSSELVRVKSLYDKLTISQKEIIPQSLKEKLVDAWSIYQELLSQTTIEYYYFQQNNPYFSATKGNGAASGTDVKPNIVINDVTISRALKMESTTKVNFTTRVENATIYILLSGTTKSDNVKIDGITYTAIDGVIEVTLTTAKDYEITRGSGEGHIVYMSVTEGSK